MLRRFLFIFIVLFAALISLFVYWRLTANDMSILLREGEPIAIRLALLDDKQGLGKDSLEFLAQIIIFPKQKGLLLYCVNTDAHYNGDLIRKMSPRSADHFGDYTELYSKDYIHIKRSQGERLLDILGGITFFVGETLFLKGTEYQYPNGVRYYPGEQIFEYMFSYQSVQKQSSAPKNPQERLLRQESMLLNLYWQRKILAAQLATQKLQSLALDLISSSLSQAELVSLMEYLLDEDIHLSVLELPLELRRYRGRNILSVKEERAAKFFRDRFAKAKIRWQKDQENYALQILNGTPTPGLARRLKFSLQNLGPRIIDVDNYEPKPLLRTMLVERSGDTSIAKHLMELMYMNKERVSFRRKISDIELSLIIGNDFSLKKFQLR